MILNGGTIWISKALETFVKQIRLNAGKIKIFERNIRGILREFLETVAPICAYNILAQNQFTYWKSLSEEDIQQILTSKDIEKFLSDKINDSSFKIHTNKESIPEIIKKLIENGVKIYTVKEEEISLEDAFLKRTGGNIID